MRHRTAIRALWRPAAPFTGLLLILGACQALPPAVGTALVGFGQDVLAAAAANFAPQYAASMENLFLAMAETATGMPFTQPVQDGGDPYAEAGYPDGEYANGEYAEEPYGQVDYGASAAIAPTAPSGYPPPAGIGLDVALLAQERLPGGQVRLRPVQDGDVLHDGRGDPEAGDKIKIFFSANCACHVYVIGVDATGYVANIFPDGVTHTAGPVTPGAQYLVPGGSTWWGLDTYRGIEQIYFIASHTRRPDIERLVAELAGRRPDLPASYRPVREPAVLTTTRGLAQVQSAAPTVVATEQGAGQPVSPTSFQSTVADADLVITRWFRHE
ncbi:MAG TPA: DUF4384 domain-containing protein [Pseudomonadales bacterium]